MGRLLWFTRCLPMSVDSSPNRPLSNLRMTQGLPKMLKPLKNKLFFICVVNAREFLSMLVNFSESREKRREFFIAFCLYYFCFSVCVHRFVNGMEPGLWFQKMTSTSTAMDCRAHCILLWILCCFREVNVKGNSIVLLCVYCVNLFYCKS